MLKLLVSVIVFQLKYVQLNAAIILAEQYKAMKAFIILLIPI